MTKTRAFFITVRNTKYRIVFEQPNNIIRTETNIRLEIIKVYQSIYKSIFEFEVFREEIEKRVNEILWKIKDNPDKFANDAFRQKELKDPFRIPRKKRVTLREQIKVVDINTSTT